MAGTFFVLAGLGVLAAHGTPSGAQNAPPGDFGDAPVGDNGDGILAYPGVLARWVSWYQHRNTVTAPVQHLHGTWLLTGATFRLGEIPPTATMDTAQQPGAAENDANPVIVLEELGSNPLAQMHLKVSTTVAHDPDQTFYLNVFVDQDRTGEWKDGWYLGAPVASWQMEWVAQDVPIRMNAGEVRDVTLGYVRLAAPTHPVWLRLIVSDAQIGTILKAGEPFWDGTMLGDHGWSGEVEDHYLEYQTSYTPGAKGIYPWWVYGRGSGGGGGNPKPACDAFYHGPRTVWTPLCPATVQFNTIYRVSERNDGCDPGLLFGMYGLKPLKGAPPPIVTLNNPAFFKPGTLGDNTMNCPDGTVLTLPANVEGFPPMSQGVVTADALRGGVVPPAFEACYPPGRARVYRAFLEVLSCGSAHQSVAVQTGPAGTYTPSAIVAIGQRVDHVDFMIGDLIEAFIDPLEDRPFPDPDFVDYAIAPLAPGGEGYLDEDTFASEPASLRLQNAIYNVSPQFGDNDDLRLLPRPWMPNVSFAYHALPSPEGENTVMFISALGEVFEQILPDGEGWTEFTTTMPDGFELETIQIAMRDGWVDDLVVELAPATDCNGNGRHDTFDIASGLSADLDGNGIPDECEPDNPCAGNCGSQAPSGCWCDELCAEYGDCCEGAAETCAEADPTGVGAGGGPPTALAVSNVAPNPFNPRTTIRFDLPRAGEASVTVHDVRGRLVRTLWRGVREAGRHRVEWDGRDERGGMAAAGVYLVRVTTADGSSQAVKVTLAK